MKQTYSYSDLFARTELLLGAETMRAFQSKKVILFGVGGVGGWCAEGLVRSGITRLTIVDPDRVAAANINRQLPATTKTVGRLKVEVLRERLLEINPEAEIRAITQIYSAESCDSFHLEEYDYIIDAIDSLQHKAHLLVAASKTDAVVFSSMGAALKTNPLQIRIAEFWKVRGCKLASALRQRLRKSEKPAKPIVCVYSEELRENKTVQPSENADEKGSFHKAQTNGTLVAVTATFGLVLSALVVEDVERKSGTPT